MAEGSARVAAACLALLALAACGERELILPGEREDVSVATDGAGNVVPAVAEPGEVPPLVLPPAARNADWTHPGGSATHLGGHPALDGAVSRIWSADIGAGNGKRTRLTAAPVVAGGRVFTLDANAQVTAFSTEGATLWRTDLTRPGEGAGEGLGGGLAVDGGTLFAATGFGEVVALDAASGDIRWRGAVEAAIRSAPAADGGVVVAIGRNDVAYGFDAATGAAVWRVQGIGRGPGLLGGSTPAIRAQLTVLPMISGEVMGVATRNGFTAWTTALRDGREGQVRAQIADITGGPVIDGDVVYAANYTGRLAALDRRSGERLWTLGEGAVGLAVPAGNSVFLLADTGEVMRVAAADGRVLWRTALPEWVRPDRRRLAIPHFGPVLAGGRLWVAGGDGLLRAFDPATGTEAGAVEVPGGAAGLPAVAGGRMYVVSGDGQLHAFQ
jgi:outer membrane protein assembly factor BamB